MSDPVQEVVKAISPIPIMLDMGIAPISGDVLITLGYSMPEGVEGPVVLKVDGNRTVADIERALATALETIAAWWESEHPGEHPELTGVRDVAMANKTWTPFDVREGVDDEPGE